MAMGINVRDYRKCNQVLTAQSHVTLTRTKTKKGDEMAMAINVRENRKGNQE